MRIKGVSKKKGSRGEVIELNASEKAKEAVKLAVTLDAFKDDADFLYYVNDKSFTLEGEVSKTPKGNKLKRKWENNNYTATGEAIFAPRNIASGKLHQQKKKKFKIKFADILDGMGQPDLKVTEFSTTATRRA
jgi:hypothetical protein